MLAVREVSMGRPGLFDLNRRYESLNEKNDPLVAIAAMVPFEYFQPKPKAALFLPGVNLVRRNFLARRQAATVGCGQSKT
jgi:hypothetical protein